jgi:beta-glucosidase/6-phospho-beta-glucosidase/beta-galactosidase
MTHQHDLNLAPMDEVSVPQVWGGVECTCNRVGDTYFDQMDCSGHRLRLSDFELFAGLGIRALRIGLLWEREACDSNRRWTTAALVRLQTLKIKPIAGLVHHGSGPPHTSLLDPEFPAKLADYAERVARQYPFLDAYTPVNEPNTTARFSGMYGVWYPHHLSRPSYLRALINQLKGTVLSMQKIRNIRPDAQLVQTEDCGFISGTKELRPVWELLNVRRWLTFDLLCGRVDRSHPMLEYMRSHGIPERDILWFADHPCPPDVIGINYYATSDRFIDGRVELYPPDRMSAEGAFVDVEAVRVKGAILSGFDTLLLEAWRRYRIPVAITEVHLGGRIDEQIRWAAYAWSGIRQAQRQGASCAAITFWSLLGSHFWNQLVTCANGHYEPGVFDVRGGVPVETELAGVVRQIAAGAIAQHPALGSAGWWTRPERVCFPTPYLAAA